MREKERESERERKRERELEREGESERERERKTDILFYSCIKTDITNICYGKSTGTFMYKSSSEISHFLCVIPISPSQPEGW